MKRFIQLFLFVSIPIILLVKPVYAQEPEYKIGFNYQMAPFQFIDSDGSVQGMHIDIIENIFNRTNIEFVPFFSNTDSIEALKEGQIDLVLGVNTNLKLDDDISRIEGLSTASLCTIAPSDIASELNSITDYRRMRVSFEYRTISYSYLSELGVTSFVAYGNQDMLYQAMLDGSAPLVVGIKECIIYRLDQDRLLKDYTIIHDYVTSIDFGILTRSSDHRLQRQISEGLATLRTGGSYEQIYRSWIVEPGLQATQDRLAHLTRLIIIVLLSAGGCIAAISLFNRSMKRLVAQKTVELTELNQQLECRLQQLSSESQLRNNMIQYSPSSMIMFDSKFQITLLNEPAEKLLGISVERALGLDVRDLPIVGEIIKQEGSALNLFSLEYSHVHPREFQIGENPSQTYRYSVCSVRDTENEPNALISIEDVTGERRRLHEMFEVKKNQQLNRMAAAIAHEIKNPLMAMKTAASLIIDSPNDPEVLDAFRRFVPNEIDRINTLVNGFVAYARPATDKPVEISIPDLIYECLNLAHITAKKSKIQFTVDLLPTVIIASKDQIRQSIINIMINGIDAMELKLKECPNQQSNMHMDIKAYPDGEDAVIIIRDTGVGMTAEQCAQCTKPYFTTKQTGTGLGLSIVSRFVKDSGGTITIESELGKYTQVTLRFRREHL